MKRKNRNIYLLRHGESELPRGFGKFYIGQTDPPLSRQGREQAGALGKRFSRVPLGSILSSDLARSAETARIIAGGGPHPEPLPLPSLREIDLGAWDGKPMREIQSAFPEEYQERGNAIDVYRPPRGESFSDLAGRIIPVFRGLLDENDGNILIVGHAGVNRVILCDILETPLRNLLLITQDYGCVNILREGSMITLELMNGSPG